MRSLKKKSLNTASKKSLQEESCNTKSVTRTVHKEASDLQSLLVVPVMMMVMIIVVMMMVTMILGRFLAGVLHPDNI